MVHVWYMCLVQLTTTNVIRSHQPPYPWAGRTENEWYIFIFIISIIYTVTPSAVHFHTVPPFLPLSFDPSLPPYTYSLFLSLCLPPSLTVSQLPLPLPLPVPLPLPLRLPSLPLPRSPSLSLPIPPPSLFLSLLPVHAQIHKTHPQVVIQNPDQTSGDALVVGYATPQPPVPGDIYIM